MRKSLYVFLAITLLSHVVAFATLPPISDATGKYTYIQTKGPGVADKLTADEILKKCKEWGKNKGYTEEATDKAGRVIFNGSFKVTYTGTKGGTNLTGKVTFKMTIDCKENKYRVIMTDFVHEEPRGSGGELEAKSPACGSSKMKPTSWTAIKNLTNSKSLDILNGKDEKKGLSDVIKKHNNDPARNDDW